MGVLSQYLKKYDITLEELTVNDKIKLYASDEGSGECRIVVTAYEPSKENPQVSEQYFKIINRYDGEIVYEAAPAKVFRFFGEEYKKRGDKNGKQ
jgi:hypothetical protein